MRAKLDAQLARAFALDDYSLTPASDPLEGRQPPESNSLKPGGGGGTVSDDEAREEEFEFRLFSTQNSTAKIVLKEDDILAGGEGGLVAPERPLSYYVASEATAEQLAQFEAAALTGDEVLERSKQRWWGMEMPWRVTSAVASTRKNLNAGDAENGDAMQIPDEGNRKKRPGKKKRIAVRTKLRAQRERDMATKKKLEEEERLKVEKEQHIMEKKQRLNRQRKLKRRAKEREKKGVPKTDGPDGG